MHRNLLVLAPFSALVALSLCGCSTLAPAAESVRPADAAPPAASGHEGARPIAAFSAVTVTFSPHAQERSGADPRLSAEAIAAALEDALRAQQLYQPVLGDTHRTLVVTVEDFTNDLSSNATVLGFTFRNLGLLGEVQVKDAASLSMPFDVHARSRQRNRTAGSGAGSLADLFTRFATLVVADLRGVAATEAGEPR